MKFYVSFLRHLVVGSYHSELFSLAVQSKFTNFLLWRQAPTRMSPQRSVFPNLTISLFVLVSMFFYRNGEAVSYRHWLKFDFTLSLCFITYRFWAFILLIFTVPGRHECENQCEPSQVFLFFPSLRHVWVSILAWPMPGDCTLLLWMTKNIMTMSWCRNIDDKH